MGVPEWFLYLDSRKTKSLYSGKCIQIRLHFTGPYANKLEQDFARLLRTGKLDQPSFAIPGYNVDPLRKTKLGYRECGSDNFKNSIRPSTSNAYDLYSSIVGGGSSGGSGLLGPASIFQLVGLLVSLAFWV